MPAEILLEIFSTFLLDAKCFPNDPNRRLSLVEKHVIGRPILWTKICVPSVTIHGTLAYFERLKPALIDIKFDTSWSRGA
ncbi:hypothetical protein BDZ97DRAFT_1786303 [Flammula alnicola]|nr:hypothetical protein BDZ97DRAFT_1786303 [Flammula alnicola]